MKCEFGSRKRKKMALTRFKPLTEPTGWEALIYSKDGAKTRRPCDKKQ